FLQYLLVQNQCMLNLLDLTSYNIHLIRSLSLTWLKAIPFVFLTFQNFPFHFGITEIRYVGTSSTFDTDSTIHFFTVALSAPLAMINTPLTSGFFVCTNTGTS